MVNNIGQSYFPSTSSSSTSSSPALNGSVRVNGNSTPGKETLNNKSRGSVNGHVASTPTLPIEKDQNNINIAPGMEDTLFSSLKDLFWKISTHKKKTGVIAPVNFINKVKKENGKITKLEQLKLKRTKIRILELFRSSMHQDAHEFLNYILNTIADDVQKYQQRFADEQSSIHSGSSQGNDTETTTASKPKTTWVHQLFEGIFSNETKCLSCETVSA